MDHPGNVFWKRQDEATTLTNLDKAVDQKQSFSHRCIFWDFNGLSKHRKKDVAFVFAMTLFEISDDNFLEGEIHNLRKKSGIKSKLQDIFGKCNFTVISPRLIKFEGMPSLKNESDQQQLEKIFLLYFVEIRGIESKILQCALDSTKKCKEVNKEIDNLTSSRSLISNKFRQQVSTLLLFQEVEHKNFSKEFGRDMLTKSVKTMSKNLLKLRELHSIELKTIQKFQENFNEIINTNLRWLLSKNGDLSLLEKIEKVQVCVICESALSFFTKIPDQKEQQAITTPEIKRKKVAILRTNCIPSSLNLSTQEDHPTSAGDVSELNLSNEKRLKVKMNHNNSYLNEYQNTSDRKKYHSNSDVSRVSPFKSNQIDDDLKVIRVNQVGYMFPNSADEKRSHSKSPSPIPKKHRDQVLPKLFPTAGRTVKTEQDHHPAENVKASNKSYIDFIQESSNNYNKVRFSPGLAGNFAPLRPKRSQTESQNNIDDLLNENKKNSRVITKNVNQSLVEENWVVKTTKQFQGTLGYLEYLKKTSSSKVGTNENNISQNKSVKLPELQKEPSGNQILTKINQAMNEEMPDSNISFSELNDALKDGVLKPLMKKSALKSPELRKFVNASGGAKEYLKARLPSSQRKKIPPLVHNKSMNDDNKHVSFATITEITIDSPDQQQEEGNNSGLNELEKFEKFQIHKFPSGEPNSNISPAPPSDQIPSSSDPTPTIRPQKLKFSNIVEEHIKHHKKLPQNIVYHDSESKVEREVYMQRLMDEKPWLDRLFLTWFKFDDLKENFPLSNTKPTYAGKQKDEFENELSFIHDKINPLKSKSKDLKTDLELAYDLRYYNRYGDLLVKRIQSRNFYERLELKKDCVDIEIKAAFRAKALIWHPDNTKKTNKHCFANEKAYINTIAQVFSLIDEAYKTLSNSQLREQYNDANQIFQSLI